MKKSISKQFTIIFVLVTAGAFLLCWTMTNLFLGRFYIYYKMQELSATYDFLNLAAQNNQFNDSEFKKQLQLRCGRFNTDVLVVDVDSQVITYAGSNPESTKMMLWDTLFLPETENQQDSDEEHRDVLQETDTYIVKIVHDRILNNQNLTMWGTLNNGNMFLIRSALESIQDSVHLANRFLAIIGCLTVLIFGLLIWFITRKMTKPIMALADISQKMSHLDFEARYEGKEKNEIGLLGANINSMSETLKETISELKEVNVELRRDIQEKEQIENMRTEFLSNVSHELKTPIALIQGYAEGLQEGFLEDAESREYYCSVICDEASKMNHIVQKLLTLNQLEFGQDTVNMERFDIVDLIKNQLQLSSVLLQQAEIKIHFNGEEPVFVWGDSFMVGEVFANYLSNAIHYCENEKIIDIRLEAKEDKLRVVCFNSGDRIPEEAIPHLWEKFYKVDKARTRTYGGSGVGLSIVKAIMESMGQNYGVNNYENGVGFWFELDLK